jgi:hypothetical protein
MCGVCDINITLAVRYAVEAYGGTARWAAANYQDQHCAVEKIVRLMKAGYY